LATATADSLFDLAATPCPAGPLRNGYGARRGCTAAAPEFPALNGFSAYQPPRRFSLRWTEKPSTAGTCALFSQRPGRARRRYTCEQGTGAAQPRREVEQHRRRSSSQLGNKLHIKTCVGSKAAL
jgi:hypothetical protein